MTVETASNISELDSSRPLPGDETNEGDAHIRLIKAVLKAQFPGTGGDGFASAITAIEDEINHLSGVTSNIQDQIDALTQTGITLGYTLNAPAGTKMFFAQAAAPVGWTQDTTYDDYTLRLVAGVGGGTGGTDSPFTTDFSHIHETSDHTLTVDEMPAHNHPIKTCGDSNTVVVNSFTARISVGAGSNPLTSSVSINGVGGDQPHNHGDTGSGDLTFTPLYLNTIIATKD